MVINRSILRGNTAPFGPLVRPRCRVGRIQALVRRGLNVVFLTPSHRFLPPYVPRARPHGVVGSPEVRYHLRNQSNLCNCCFLGRPENGTMSWSAQPGSLAVKRIAAAPCRHHDRGRIPSFYSIPRKLGLRGPDSFWEPRSQRPSLRFVSSTLPQTPESWDEALPT